ncbi:phospholipase D-like domain-containing protein [Actinophytocola xanthii]|uniref:Uncharacterized protein n=1 Tax=Actinophytocola xanthii TaxID=1912961 RepID=A0A1Q8CKL6_9PSEU|nr:hypothetical protein [Actinophytocola xanthii]OLF14879.1 hypothetical protein BU204_24360 [Actinophytocola xanthii]
MSEPTTVYVPCDVIPVRAEFSYGSGLSPMEESTLRAVVAGFDAVAELSSLLGLGERLTLDLISDLWHRGYLLLDFSRGTLQPSAQVRQAVLADDLSELHGAERVDEQRMIMVEKLTGHVLSVRRGRKHVRDNRFVVPIDVNGGWAEQVTGAQLAAVLDEEESQTTTDLSAPPTRQRQVVSVHRLPVGVQTAIEQRWLPVEIRVGVDPDTEGILVSVSGTTLPADRRTEAGRRITRLLEEYSDSTFARYLRGRATRRYEDPRSLEVQLERLEKRAARAVTAPAGTRTAYHRELSSEARQVYGLLQQRVRSEVDARLVGGRDEQLAAVLALIESARQQIVLVSPQIQRDGLLPLIEPLRAALKDGRQVAIVWGSRRDDQLDSWVRTALMDLRGAAGRDATNLRMVWTPRPARMNARLAIADDRRAIITGAPLLDPQRDRRQLGVELTAPDGGMACEPIESLLRWVARAMPEYRLGQALYVRHSEFTQQADDSGAAELVSFPDPPLDRQGDEVADSAVLAWGEAWVGVAASFRERLAARHRVWAEILEDGAHREALSRLLREPRQRITVSSVRVSAQVITPRFVATLRNQAEAGARISLTHRRSAENDPAGPLHELSRAFPNRVRIERISTSAPVMAGDDETVVTSFDLLSLGASSTVRSRYPFGSELGVRIVGAELAALVHQIIANSAGTPADDGPGEGDPAETGPSRHVPASGAQRLLNDFAAADGPDQARRVRDAVAGSADPIALLDELEHVRPGRTVLRLAAAALVCRHDLRELAATQRWLQWLVLDQWRAGLFPAAAVLRQVLPDTGWSPRPVLATMAAAHRTRWSPHAVYAAVVDGLQDKEKSAIVAVGVTDLLLGTDDMDQLAVGKLNDALELLEGVQSPWDGLAAAASRYWDTYHKPVPLRHILEADDNSRLDDELAAAWQQLTTALLHAARTTFDFDNGQKIHGRLFHPDGVFGGMGAIAEAHDGAALRSWLDVHGGRGASGLIDQATREALPRGGSLHSRRRRSYEQRLAAVLTAARLVRELSAAQTNAPDSNWVDDARPVARELAGLWPSLVSATDETEEPERYLIRSALKTLEPVARWGEP